MSIVQMSLEHAEDVQCFRIVAVANYRINSFNFGNIVQGVKRGDVNITPDAIALLLNQPERPIGVAALEFWDNKSFGWNSSSMDFFAPVTATNLPVSAREWVKTLFTVKELNARTA